MSEPDSRDDRHDPGRADRDGFDHGRSDRDGRDHEQSADAHADRDADAHAGDRRDEPRRTAAAARRDRDEAAGGRDRADAGDGRDGDTDGSETGHNGAGHNDTGHNKTDHDEAGHDDTGKDEPPPPPPRRRLALFVAIPLVLLLLFGAFNHWRSTRAAEDTQRQARDATVDVQVAQAKQSSDVSATSLPGQTLAFTSSDLYARATGYIAERKVDIGSRVKKGDLLLRIAAPDLDQQLAQAQAQLGQMEAQLAEAHATFEQAQATAKNNKTTSMRSKILESEGWDTAQNRDNTSTTYNVSTKSVSSAQAGIGVAVANVRAQQATVDRLVALTGFERVVAPFDGVITARDVDVGNLVQSDANTGTALLHIDQNDVLRCQVYVPQSQFVGIRDGLPARVMVPELPGRVFRATVSRSSASLAQNSRSMLVEVDIDNKDGTLAPGLFVTVGFDVARPTPRVVVPDAALIFDQNGMNVAVVENGKAQMRKVSIERDTGTEADLSDGLKGGEQVIMNPPTNLENGQAVHVLPPDKNKS